MSRAGDAPLWRSGFRPFYLLGAVYAPLLAAGAIAAWMGRVDLARAGLTPPLWHGHEMLFGFAMAIVLGTLLTALPSWTGIAEVRGRRLMTLAALWAAGRAGFWLAPWLPADAVAALDIVLLPVLTGMLARPLWRVKNRLYRLLLPILLAMIGANLAFHVAWLAGDARAAERALRAALWALVVLFTLKGGVLTGVFTGNALNATQRGTAVRAYMPLEAAALALLVALAVADVAGASRTVTGALAVGAAVTQAARLARWRGWRVTDVPLLPSLHLAFVWLVVALALKAWADLGSALPEKTWTHAFAVGALGLMMLGLMTRVVLRHTGRAPVVPGVMKAAAVAVFAAAVLRVAAGVREGEDVALAIAGVLWAAAFVVYALRFGAWLVGPSLPMETGRAVYARATTNSEA